MPSLKGSMIDIIANFKSVSRRSTVQEKVMDDWRLKRKMFGWWSPTGKSFQPDSHLVLLNALFLRD